MKVLVTAGPTYEAIDPVRFIGNHSSGKMGIAIAEELTKRGAEVILVLGPSSQQVGNRIYQLVHVRSAEEMYEASVQHFPDCQLAIMSAAVADYTPVNIASEKIKKQEGTMQINLKRTKDILATLGTMKKQGQWLVGFALETTNEKEYALGKLNSKNADMIVLNSLNDVGAGFGVDTNKVSIFSKNMEEITFTVKSKKEVAVDIANTIKQLMHV